MIYNGFPMRIEEIGLKALPIGPQWKPCWVSGLCMLPGSTQDELHVPYHTTMKRYTPRHLVRHLGALISAISSL